MGAGLIVQDNIRKATSSLWDKLPTLPHSKLLDFDTSAYNKSFVNLAVVVGSIALVKTAITLGSTLKNSLVSSKLPTTQQLAQKYGYHSWVLVGDCSHNEQYCRFFAKNGFNLILMGAQQDIRIAREQVDLVNQSIRVQSIVVDWKKEESNVSFYESLLKNLQHFDISFLVLPKLDHPKEDLPTHLEHYQPFSHIYLLVRFLGQKLKWRSYKSAIIFPSYRVHEEVSASNGISKALIAGSDAFGRIVSHEFREAIEVVVARGSVEQAIKGLGVRRITH